MSFCLNFMGNKLYGTLKSLKMGTIKLTVSYLKFNTLGLQCKSASKEADDMSDSADLDQTVSSGAV